MPPSRPRTPQGPQATVKTPSRNGNGCGDSFKTEIVLTVALETLARSATFITLKCKIEPHISKDHKSYADMYIKIQNTYSSYNI